MSGTDLTAVVADDEQLARDELCFLHNWRATSCASCCKA